MPRPKKRDKDKIVQTVYDEVDELPKDEQDDLAERMYCFAMGWKARDALKKKPA